MSDNTSITIRLDAATTEKLERLARDTNCSKSLLATQAISAYVEREIEIVEGIQHGFADVKARRVVPHDEAMNRIDTAIDRVRKR